MASASAATAGTAGKTTVRSLAGIALAGFGMASCDSALFLPPPRPFEIHVHVESDPGHPLAGAVLMKDGKEGPATGPDGIVSVKLSGAEGETVDLGVKCPADFVSIAKPLSVSLRRGSKVPEYGWACPPAIRHMVVAVRAQNGPNLPVRWFGRAIGRTDANGAFTAVFPMRPGDTVELQLDTSDKANDRIHPKNPVGSFTMKPYDDVVTFDTKFDWDPVPGQVRKVNIPVRIPERERS